MFSKSTLLGTLVGFLFFYLIGWLFYDSLAADYFDTHRVNMMMGELNMFYLTLGSLIQAYVLSVYTDVGVTAIVPFVRAFALGPGWVPLSVLAWD